MLAGFVIYYKEIINHENILPFFCRKINKKSVECWKSFA
ncbi:hypothetical protein lbkm_0092 [Lachnospiraceae bacterium KM106-2]|nr:hypothetical protein lbkm_0092 [Lachnospiraceae bacterium KM106-2]